MDAAKNLELATVADANDVEVEVIEAAADDDIRDVTTPVVVYWSRVAVSAGGVARCGIMARPR